MLLIPRPSTCVCPCFGGPSSAKHKGGIKIHTLYDIETQVPAFFHITEASVNDVRAMDELTYEPGTYYIFDRGYNDFSRLYRIAFTESHFVVRAMKNLQ